MRCGKTGLICEARSRGLSRQGPSPPRQRQDDRRRWRSRRRRARGLPRRLPCAEAYIFECTGKAAKTHRGVKSQFNRLARQETRIGRDLLTFLEEGYQFKAIADYGVGPAIDTVSAGDAASAIVTAERFIETIAELLLP